MSSLVAYDSSDDSDSNDAGDIEEKQNNSAVKKTEKVEPQAQSAQTQVPHSVSVSDSDSQSFRAAGQEKGISDKASNNSVPIQTSADSGQQKLDQNVVHLASSQSENLAAVSSSTKDPHISDDDDDFMVEQNRDGASLFGLRLPPPKAAVTTDGLARGGSTENGLSSGSSLFSKLPAPKTDPTAGTLSILGLPQPKPTSSTAAPPSSITDDTLEDMVKPKPAELEIAAKLKPPGKKKTKQPVKITIPALPDVDSDEDEPKSKRPKSSEGKSGLFSLLPAPMHAPKKETNRKLIPHTLTRKPASASAPPTRKTTPKASQGLKPSGNTAKLPGIPGMQQDDESDDEEAGSSTNFFSLGSDSEKAALAASSYTVTSSISTLPPVSGHRVNPEPEGPQSTATQDSTITSSGPLPSASLLLDKAGTSKMDAPLQFKSSFNPAAPPVGEWVGQSQGYQPYHDPGVSATSSAGAANQDYYTNQQYNYANLNEEDYPEVPEEPSSAELGPDGQDMDMEQLFRLQGKKRGGKEQINIIDVHADDHVSGLDLTKTLTEETDMMSHSKKKNKDMPSSQQKRKHQITYLAFKAKERELALKNQWAENRSTRKQTQAKYGF